MEVESSDVGSTRHVCPQHQLIEKIIVFSVKKIVTSFISLLHLHQTPECGILPETIKTLFFLLKLKVEISLLWKFGVI